MTIKCIMEERPKKYTTVVPVIESAKKQIDPILNEKKLVQIVGKQFKKIDFFPRNVVQTTNDTLYLYNSDAAIHVRVAATKNLPDLSMAIPGMYEELLNMCQNETILSIPSINDRITINMPLRLPEASYSQINSSIQINLHGKPFCYYMIYRNIMIVPYVSFNASYLEVLFSWLWPKILEMCDISKKDTLKKNLAIIKQFSAIGIDYFVEKFHGKVLNDTIYILDDKNQFDILDLRIIDSVNINAPKMSYEHMDNHLKNKDSVIFISNAIDPNGVYLAIEVTLNNNRLCYYLPEKDSFIFGEILWHPDYMTDVIPKVWPLIVEKLELNEGSV